MKALASTYRQQGLTVVAVDLDQSRSDGERFLSAFQPNFTVIFDPRGGLAQRFKLVGMPTSFLIDRQGKVRFTHVGFLPRDRAQYEQQVRSLLAGQ